MFYVPYKKEESSRESTVILAITNSAAQNMYGVDIFCSDLLSTWLTQHLTTLFNTSFYLAINLFFPLDGLGIFCDGNCRTNTE